jgi:uncharacterized UBP type Zn finger protein
MNGECQDFDEPRHVTASAVGCEDCEKTGDEWVHLRICLVCGHVGCCDNSLNRHATRHAQRTSHPIIASYEPGEGWAYCYPHDRYLETVPTGFAFDRKR